MQRNDNNQIIVGWRASHSRQKNKNKTAKQLAVTDDQKRKIQNHQLSMYMCEASDKLSAAVSRSEDQGKRKNTAVSW